MLQLLNLNTEITNSNGPKNNKLKTKLYQLPPPLKNSTPSSHSDKKSFSCMLTSPMNKSVVFMPFLKEVFMVASKLLQKRITSLGCIAENLFVWQFDSPIKTFMDTCNCSNFVVPKLN